MINHIFRLARLHQTWKRAGPGRPVLNLMFKMLLFYVLMLVDTENTSDQFITRLAVDMNIHGDLHGWISNFFHIYGYGGYPSLTGREKPAHF